MILTDPCHGFYWFDGFQARARTSIAYRKLKRGRQNISIFISGQFDMFYKSLIQHFIALSFFSVQTIQTCFESKIFDVLESFLFDRYFMKGYRK